MRLRQKITRRGLAAGLVLFAGFRIWQLVEHFVNDPSGVTLAESAGVPLAIAIALKGALPIHLACVALLLQRPYVTPPWARFAWLATVATGCWLATALLIRLVLHR